MWFFVIGLLVAIFLGAEVLFARVVSALFLEPDHEPGPRAKETPRGTTVVANSRGIVATPANRRGS